MPNSTQGIAVIGDYVTPATGALKVAALNALIPFSDDPVSSSSGAVAGGGHLDEMSPAAAIQLHVELAALAANAAGSGQTVAASGSHTITAGEVTATTAIITPGVAVTEPKLVITVRRAAAIISVPAAALSYTGTTFALATGGVYTLTAGDVISWVILP